MSKFVTIHCYIDQLIDNTDGKFDALDSAWFTVSKDWAEQKAKASGCESLESFLKSYTYDDTDGWLHSAIQQGVLVGCGAGDMRDPEHIEYEPPTPIEEEKEYELVSCQACNGSGWIQDDEEKCSDCWGSGLVTDTGENLVARGKPYAANHPKSITHFGYQ